RFRFFDRRHSQHRFIPTRRRRPIFLEQRQISESPATITKHRTHISGEHIRARRRSRATNHNSQPSSAGAFNLNHHSRCAATSQNHAATIKF
ncbi:MAG TPA: hypothetical protein VKS00_01810, partial [Candidatus Acidoferrales bacterium]|nr:hypothetical protein [Candidatus Acidoferrales bacterium]